MIDDFSTCGTRRFPHRTNKTETLAWQGFDEALFVSGIADCAAGDIQTGRQRAVGDGPAVSNGVDEVVFTDDAFPVADQVIEQVQNLWCNGDDVRPAM
jgi:hypothetical protein